MPKLAILIPARNEKYLKRTLQDIFEHSTDDTEVIVGLDGYTEDLTDINGRVTVFRTQEPIGQRAMTNELARLTTAEYVMKIDAHVSFSHGFDTAMLKDAGEDITLVPVLLNLRPFHWVCKQGHMQQHSNKQPEQCFCGEKEFTSVDSWKVVPKPICSSFYLDTNLIFNYCPIQSTELVNETMAIQGSGWLVSRKKYWELDLSGEEFGSWGQQGAEVSLKTWLSGGTVLCTKRAYMGHWFRQSDEFPYQRDMKQVDHAISTAMISLLLVYLQSIQ